MRIFFGIVILSAAIGVLAAGFAGCGGDAEPIHAACKNFCESLVSAWDDSDGYDISNTGEAEQKCMHECTDSIEGINDGDLQDDVEDCVDCVGSEAGDGADMDDFWDAVTDDCVDECFDDDYPDDPNPFDEFYEDFLEDFSEHYSNGDGGGDADSDADSDSDTDSDCDMGAYEECAYDLSDCMIEFECVDTDCDDCFPGFCSCLYDANCVDEAAMLGC